MVIKCEKWKGYQECFTLLELNRAEIRWVPLLLNPQISNLKSLKKDVQINTCEGKQASKETVRTDVTRTAGREQKTSTGNWKMGIKLN